MQPFFGVEIAPGWQIEYVPASADAQLRLSQELSRLHLLFQIKNLSDTWIDPLTSPIQLFHICGARALLYQLLHQTVSLRVRVDLFRETLARRRSRKGQR